MKQVSLRSSVHNFDKQNLVTQKTGGRMYDTLRCKKCGITGKRYGLDEYIKVPTNTSDKKIIHCDGKIIDAHLGKWVEVIVCGAAGPQWGNLKSGSVHQVVVPPDGYYNGDRGVWVQGVGEPVKMLFDEFKVVSEPAKVEDPDAWFYDYCEEHGI